MSYVLKLQNELHLCSQSQSLLSGIIDLVYLACNVFIKNLTVLQVSISIVNGIFFF